MAHGWMQELEAIASLEVLAMHEVIQPRMTLVSFASRMHVQPQVQLAVCHYLQIPELPEVQMTPCFDVFCKLYTLLPAPGN